MINIQTPETIPEPTPIDKIVDFAVDLVDKYNDQAVGGDSRFLTAQFYVPDNEAHDGKYPSLRINVPKEEFSQPFEWRAELTFGNQDPILSTHVLCRKDGSVVFSDYTGKGSEYVRDERRLEEFLSYLEDIRDNLIADL